MTQVLLFVSLFVLLFVLVVEVRRRRSLHDYQRPRTVRANMRQIPGLDDCIVTHPVAPGVRIEKGEFLCMGADGSVYPGQRSDGGGKAVEDFDG